MIFRAAFAALAGRRYGTAWSRRWGYADRATFAVVTLGFAVLVWMRALVADPGYEAAGAREAYTVFLGLQASLTALIVPLSHLLSLSAERGRASFDLLLLAPMTGFEQLLARALGRLGGVACGVAAGLPGLLLVVPAGGVEAQEVIAAQLQVLGLAAAALGTASFFGALFHAFAPAVAASWVTLAAWLAGPYLGDFLRPSIPALWETWKGFSHAGLLEREILGVRPDWAGLAAGLSLGLALLLAGCAAGGILLRPVHVRGRSRGDGEAALRRRTREWAASPRWGRFFKPLLPVRGELTRQACLMDRDRRFRVAWLILAASAVAAGGATAFLPSDGVLEAQAAVIGAGLACAVVLTAVSAASSTSSARRQGRLEALLAANVEPDEILRAGAAGRIVRGAYLALPSAVHGLILALWGWSEYWMRIPPVIGALGLALATAAVLGQTSATLARRRAIAEILALVVVAPIACLVGVFAAVSWIGLAIFGAAGLGTLLGFHAWTAGRLRRWVLG